MIYFDSTATTKPSKIAIDAFINANDECWGNPSSTNYEFGKQARLKLEQAREIIAECIGAEPRQIFFTSGSTEGINWIYSSTSKLYDIICQGTEHAATRHTTSKRVGRNFNSDVMSVLHIPDLYEYEDVDILKHWTDLLAQKIKENRFDLVSVIDINNETGVIAPTKEIADLCHSYGDGKFKVFADMTQTFAHGDVYKADDLGYDFAVAAAQKFHGIRGCGFVYARNPDDLEPLFVGGGQEMGKRAGTEPVPLIYSMAKQFAYECKWRKLFNSKIRELRKRLFEKLSSAGVSWKLNFDGVPSIASVAFLETDAQKLLSYLALDDICVSAGSACSTGKKKISDVLLNSGISPEDAESTIRISIDYTNTEDEIDTLVDAIAKAIPYCKK